MADMQEGYFDDVSDLDTHQADPQEGYLDNVFDVLDAHQHPCIVMGRSVLLWMGAAVSQCSVSVNIVLQRSQADGNQALRPSDPQRPNCCDF